MTIYVGRKDLLPEGWDILEDLPYKTEDEVRAEVSREVDTDAGYDDFNIAIYTRAEFEDSFNDYGGFNGNYWIRIF